MLDLSKNNNLIQKTANLPETEKVEATRNQEQHLQLAAGERKFYKNCCQETKESVMKHLEGVDFSLRREPCSNDGIVHYSYDYAQQLHYPTDPRQPGPIYFKTPRKCAILECVVKLFQGRSTFLSMRTRLISRAEV